MADENNEWNVPCSDGEEDSSEAAQSQGEEKWEVPLKVLLLYSEIEKNGFIELKVKEYRSDETISLSLIDDPKSCAVKEEETPKDGDTTEENGNPETSGNYQDIVDQNIDIEKEK